MKMNPILSVVRMGGSGKFDSIDTKKKKNGAHIFMPAEGWKPQTWYLVEKSMSSGNPVHSGLFFSGFLDKDGKPSGYNGCICTNTAPSESGDSSEIMEHHYLKPLVELFSSDEADNLARGGEFKLKMTENAVKELEGNVQSGLGKIQNSL